MTNVTIPDLPAGAALSGAEPLETVQSAVSVKITVQNVADFAAALAVEDITGTSYTLVLADNRKYKNTTQNSPVNIIIPANATVPFPIGAFVLVEQGGTRPDYCHHCWRGHAE